MYAAALLMPSVFNPRPSHSSPARKWRSFFNRSSEVSAAWDAAARTRRASDESRLRGRDMILLWLVETLRQFHSIVSARNELARRASKGSAAPLACASG